MDPRKYPPGVLWDLGVPNVLRHKRLPRRKGEHEAEKPVALFWDLARAVTRAGDVVADLFVGRSRWIGRFLEEGRHVVAVDRDPRWVEEIRKELSVRTWRTRPLPAHGPGSPLG